MILVSSEINCLKEHGSCHCKVRDFSVSHYCIVVFVLSLFLFGAIGVLKQFVAERKKSRWGSGLLMRHVVVKTISLIPIFIVSLQS